MYIVYMLAIADQRAGSNELKYAEKTNGYPGD